MNDAPENLDSPEGEDRPREERGAVRRDCEPHRGAFLDLLGLVTLVCGLCSYCLVVPGLGGLPLGVATLLMARRDLGLMKAGLMDPAGRTRTEGAATFAWIGIIFNLQGTVFGF